MAQRSNVFSEENQFLQCSINTDWDWMLHHEAPKIPTHRSPCAILNQPPNRARSDRTCPPACLPAAHGMGILPSTQHKHKAGARQRSRPHSTRPDTIPRDRFDRVEQPAEWFSLALLNIRAPSAVLRREIARRFSSSTFVRCVCKCTRARYIVCFEFSFRCDAVLLSQVDRMERAVAGVTLSCAMRIEAKRVQLLFTPREA